MTPKMITGAAIDALTARLSLRKPLEYSQNWEAEVAHPNDLRKYLDCYQLSEISEDEKYALMSLILYALETAKKMSVPDIKEFEERVRQAVNSDYSLHKDHLIYWALLDEESDDPDCLFCITPFIRLLLSNGGTDVASDLM